MPKKDKESNKTLEIPQIHPQPEEKEQSNNEKIMHSMEFDTPLEKVNNTSSVVMNEKPKTKRRKKLIKIFAIAGGIFALFLILIGILVGIPAYNIYKKIDVLAKDADLVKTSVSSQDIVKIKESLNKVKVDLKSLETSYKKLAWMKILPVVGAYYNDGSAAIKGGMHGLDTGEVVIKTVEPYADIIGFTSGSANKQKSGEDTANDRVQFIIETIDDVIPNLDEISQKANLAKAEIDKIDPARYPEEFRGIKVQEKIRKVKDLVDEGTMVISQGKPLLQVAPYLLGIDSSRNYLVLFQNDKELRPTGGFLTAYSIMKVKNGKFEPVSSSDIYNLDAKYRPSIEAPQPIVKYLKGPYVASPLLRLRDMNWSPDFKVSMDMFTKEMAKTGQVGQVDGIIAVDTHVVVKLLDAIGRIGVPGFGNFSTDIEPKCNCPQVIYELESFADVEGPIVWSENEPGKIVFAPKNYDNRKKIVGPLMNSILANALGQPKEKMPKLFEAGWESLLEKHVMLYSFDEKVQSASEAFNIAGRIKEYDGDYLHISDANLGGRKSNLYVQQEVNQEVEILNDGSLQKTLTITYKNNQSHDGWLNSVLPSWVRIYVPKGSQLISFDGIEEKTDPYEDLGKTVFAGIYRLRPQGVVKLTLKYKVPYSSKKEYKLMIQKQPGLDSPLYTIKVKRQKEEILLKSDKEFKFSI